MTPTNMYYQAENKAPVLGVLIFLAITIVAAVLLSVAYAYLSTLIPFIIIMVALPFGYGFGLGFAMHQGIRFGKIRGLKVQLGLAFLGALIGLYCAWAVWIAVILESGPFSLLAEPGSIWPMVQIINMTGTWGLSEGSAISGGILSAFWVAEALIIFFFALTITPEDSPFSEAANKWAVETEMPAFAIVPQPELLKAELEEKKYDLLMNMPKGSPNQSHAKVIIYDCEGSPDYYLLIQNIIMQANDKGEMESTEFDIVKNIRIDADAARAFLARRLEPV